MSNRMKAYVAIVILAGAAFFVYTLRFMQDVDIIGVLLFSVLSIIAESLLILTPGERGLSVGFAIGLAAIVIFGVPEAIWIASIGIMLRIIKKDGKTLHFFNYSFYKTLFNGANIALSSGLAGLCYMSFGGVPGTIDLNSTAYAIISSIIVYILVNAIIMSILMVFITGQGFF